MGVLIQLRKLHHYVGTAEAARLVGRSCGWVKDHKQRFDFRRKNQRRNLEFEVSSVLKVWQELNPDEDIEQHQVAS